MGNMYDPNAKLPASTITPSYVQTTATRTEKIEIGTDYINKISHNPRDSGIHSFPSSKALYELLIELNSAIKEIDPHHNFLQDNTVVTLPLLPTTFDNITTWLYENWVAVDGSLSYSGNANSNYIKIPTSVFTFPGYYFLTIELSRLDSGQVSVYDNSGARLAVYTEIGFHTLELKIPNSDIATLTFIAEGTYPDEVVVIKSIGFYRVTDRIKQYLEYYLKTVTADNPEGAITQAQLNSAVAQLRSDLITRFDTGIQTVEDLLDIHTTNNGNPHRVSYDQVGAAPTIHTHEQYTTIDDVQAKAEEIVDGHANRNDNPHGVTPSQIGAAPTIHTHDQYTTIEQVERKAEELLEVHRNNENNPHKVTYEQTGAAPKEHEHAQYTTESQVRTIVAESSTPPQPVGKTNLPMVLTAAPTGQLPNGTEGSSLTKPTTLVLLPYILHEANGAYDYYDGVAATNIPPVDGYPIQYAFKEIITEKDSSIETVVFKTETEILTPSVLLEYKFHVAREISGYTIVINDTGTFGYPTEWELYVDGKFITNHVNTTWADNSNYLNVQLDTPISGLRFSFYVKNVKLPIDANQWACRFEFEFSDIPKNSIKLVDNIAYTITGDPIPVIDGPVISDTLIQKIHPLYLYIEESITTDDPTNQKLVVNLFTKELPYEYGPIRQGYPALFGKYPPDENPIWGWPEVDKPNSLYNIENIFSDDAKYWISTDGTKEVTITHTFENNTSILGHRLVFLQDLLTKNVIPDSWTISATIVDPITLEETVSLLEQVDTYIPAIESFEENQIWWVKNYDNIVNNVSKLVITLKVNDPKVAVGICKFIPILTGPYFNTVTSESTHDAFMLGKLDIVTTHWNRNLIKFRGITIGNSCNIPIDGLNMQPSTPVTHILNNPYNTIHVECVPYVYPQENQSIVYAEVTNITNDEIIVVTKSAGRYSLHIKRLW